MPFTNAPPQVTGGCTPSSAEVLSRSQSTTGSPKLRAPLSQPFGRYRRTPESTSSTTPTGELQLIELELVEPELFFRLAAHAAARPAHHFLTHDAVH
jgi:hypothetical protein